MLSTEFWEIVEQTRLRAGSHPALVAARLQADLATFPPEEIISFDEIWEDTFRDLHTFGLWGAAYVIGGGCSDDLFDYFKAYLISYGRDLVASATREPDSLAEIMVKGSYIEEWELLMYPAWTAYRTVTGHDIPLNPREFNRPSGNAWEEADLPGLYPRLSALFDESAEQRRERLHDNARTQATLEAHGDQPHVPRLIEHVALFPALELARRAGFILRMRGFTTEEPFEHDREAVLVFRREDRVDGDHPDKFTGEIMWHLPHFNGRYDGWGCMWAPGEN
jgi:hypothetical protein